MEKYKKYIDKQLENANRHLDIAISSGVRKEIETALKNLEQVELIKASMNLFEIEFGGD